MSINIYKVETHWVLAHNAFDAVNCFLEEIVFPSDLIGVDMELGASEDISLNLSVHRLTEEEIDEKNFYCCNEDSDGCEVCEGLNERMSVSLRELLDTRGNTTLPYAIAFEQ